MPIAVNNPNQTYNPRENSPIKMPEIETCITCGQNLPSKVKPMTHEMSQYLNGDDMKGKLAIASIDDTLEIKGVTFYRIIGQDHEGKPVLAVKTKQQLAEVKSLTPVIPAPPTPISTTNPEEQK